MDEGDIFARRVLVADDERPNLLLIEEILRRAGYTNVRGTADAHAVLQLSGNRHAIQTHIGEQNGPTRGSGVHQENRTVRLSVLLLLRQFDLIEEERP